MDGSQVPDRPLGLLHGVAAVLGLGLVVLVLVLVVLVVVLVALDFRITGSGGGGEAKQSAQTRSGRTDLVCNIQTIKFKLHYLL